MPSTSMTVSKLPRQLASHSGMETRLAPHVWECGSDSSDVDAVVDGDLDFIILFGAVILTIFCSFQFATNCDL